MTGGRTRLCLTFDGGSRGNPGPAYGSFVVEGLPGLEPRIQRLTFGRATNNEAEYRTLIAGLAFLDQHLRRGDGRRANNLEIRGDSQLVLSQVEGSWRTRNARMAALRAAGCRAAGRLPLRSVHTHAALEDRSHPRSLTPPGAHGIIPLRPYWAKMEKSTSL